MCREQFMKDVTNHAHKAIVQPIREISAKGDIVGSIVSGKDIQMANFLGEMAGMLYDLVHPTIDLKVVRSEEAKEFKLISFKRDGDVGFDLPSIVPDQSFLLHPHQRAKVYTGIKFHIPDGYWIELKARSSTGDLMVLTPDAVIDTGYRGEVYPILINIGNEPVEIKHGERYIQAVLHRKGYDTVNVYDVDSIPSSERGEDGFGSTGR